MKKFSFTHCYLFVFTLNTILFCSTISAKEFPPELRVVAKSLADTLHPDVDSARKGKDIQEVLIEMQNLKFDITKVKSNNPEIQHLADESLSSVSEAITRLNKINALPKPNGMNTFWGGFTDGFLLGFGLPPTGESIRSIQRESAKEEAIKDEIVRLLKAVKKGEVAMRLLPRVAQEYTVTRQISANGSPIGVLFNEYPFPDDNDWLTITNNGRELSDCVIEATITGEKGDTATNIFYLEKWESGKTFFRICESGIEFDGEVVGRRTALHVKQVDLTLLSPTYSTSVRFNYGQKERDADYAAVFKNIKFRKCQYRSRYAGIFSDWERAFSVDMNQNVPTGTYWCATFKKGNDSYSCSSYDTDGNLQVIGNNKLTFEPDNIDVELIFPRTNFRAKCSLKYDYYQGTTYWDNIKMSVDY